MATDVVERQLVHIASCFAFRCPQRTSAEGYHASQFKTQVWNGALRVIERGEECGIQLLNPDGAIFAVAPLRKGDTGVVEKVRGSSRYFVLRLENADGRRAFLCIAFDSRDEAFDFNVAIQSRERDAEPPPSFETGKDYSLKSGETMTIKLKGKSRRKKSSSDSAAASGAAAGGIALPPPPSGGGRLRGPPKSSGRRRRGKKKSSSADAAVPAPAPAPAPVPAPAAGGSGGGDAPVAPAPAAAPAGGAGADAFGAWPAPAAAPAAAASASLDPFATDASAPASSTSDPWAAF